MGPQDFVPHALKLTQLLDIICYDENLWNQSVFLDDS